MLLNGTGSALRTARDSLPPWLHCLFWFSAFRFEPTRESLGLKGIALERTLSDASPGRSGAAQPAPFALVLLFRFEPTWQSLELKGIALERTLSDATPGRSGAAQPAPFALVLLFQIRIARLARNYRGWAAMVALVGL